MSVYKRGGVWWMKFRFQGAVIRESTGLTSKEDARDTERKRHLELREGSAGVVRARRVPMFSIAANDYLDGKKAEWAPKTIVIEKTNLGHLKPFFRGLLSDIGPQDVAEYREQRLADEASPKTVSLEIGTLRGVMLFHDLDAAWRAIRKKVKLKKAANIGRVITPAEEIALLTECRASRSRSLWVAVVLALDTCMRSSEIRLLQWRQIDLDRCVITVGKSKTEAGTGREIPLTPRALQALVFWSQLFPDRKPREFVFPTEHYGGQGLDDHFGFNGVKTYRSDPSEPMGSWKTAWELAKDRAGVECRFHDLRHTGITRLLEAGVSHPVVAEIAGWSASTAIRMIREVYGHISLNARREAVAQLENFNKRPAGPQNEAQQDGETERMIQ